MTHDYNEAEARYQHERAYRETVRVEMFHYGQHNTPKAGQAVLSGIPAHLLAGEPRWLDGPRFWIGDSVCGLTGLQVSNTRIGSVVKGMRCKTCFGGMR